MSIYLGSTLLTGSGGSGSSSGGGAPLGSLAYLVPSSTQTYVAGQEVFETDNGSFLQSGSILLPGGGGKEDASTYDASLLTEGVGSLNSNAWSYGDRNDRSGAFWNGTHIVQVSYGSSGQLVLTALNESDFSLAYTGNITSTLWPSNGGIVDGDYLIYAKSWISSAPMPSSNPQVKRVLRTDLTSHTSYATATSVNSSGTTVDWDMPSGYRNYPLFTACNQGLSNEKYYFANYTNSSGTAYCTIGQCTYNDAAGTNTSPWTLTGSTIVLPVTSGTRIVSLAGDLNTLWVQTNTNIIYKYNSTTLALESTILIPPNLQTTWSNNITRNGIFIIPASESSTGVTRFFMNTETQSSSFAPIFKEVFIGQLIQAPSLFSLTTHDGTNITAGSGNVNGWMKIK